MKMEEKDLLLELFRELPDEELPVGFNRTMMSRIGQEIERLEKKRRLQIILGYVAAGVTLLVGVVIVLYFKGFTLSKLQLLRVDMSVFKSPQFILSVQIGSIALLLLMADTLIHSYFNRKRMK